MLVLHLKIRVYVFAKHCVGIAYIYCFEVCFIKQSHVKAEATREISDLQIIMYAELKESIDSDYKKYIYSFTIYKHT